jgi:hypothetical protein
MLNALSYRYHTHSNQESLNIYAIYACLGCDAMKVTGILRSDQNDSIVQDCVDQFKNADIFYVYQSIGYFFYAFSHRSAFIRASPCVI